MPLHVYYDTRVAPATFDFATYLVGADLYRQSIGVSSSYIYIVAPHFRGLTAREKSTNEEEMRWRLHHILSPLPHLIPQNHRITIQNDTFNQISYPVYPPTYPPAPGKDFRVPYTPASLFRYVDAGMDIQPFVPSERGRYLTRNITAGHEYYTITLRTTRFQPDRNSNLESWYKVYKELVARGKKVWVIPDFEDFFGDRLAFNYDWQIAHFAIFDLQLRMALYHDAKDNLYVSNGIGTLLMFSKSPLKMFRVSNPSHQSTNEKYFAKNFRIEAGESPKFFQDNQKWIWLDDSAENILETIEE